MIERLGPRGPGRFYVHPLCPLSTQLVTKPTTAWRPRSGPAANDPVAVSAYYDLSRARVRD